MTLLKFPIGMENMGSLREHRMAHQDSASENEIFNLPAETPQERQAASSIDELKRQNTDLEAKLKASEEAKRKLTEEIQGIDARLKKMEASRDSGVIQKHTPSGSIKLRPEVMEKIYADLMARHGASRGTSGVLRSQGTQYKKDAAGQFVSSRGKTVRADHLQSEAREKQRRVADAQARAAQLRRLDEDRHKPEYRSVLPEHRLRPGESMSWQEGQARLQEIYARRDGGTVVSPGYISYAPGQAQFRPDDDGGSYGTSSGIGRTDYDRQVKSPRYQAQMNENALQRSNERIAAKNLPMLRAELEDYFARFDEQLQQAKDARNNNQSFEHLLPKNKEQIWNLRTLWKKRLFAGTSPQDQYSDLMIIKRKLEALQGGRSLSSVISLQSDQPSEPQAQTVRQERGTPSVASPRTAPSRTHAPEHASSNPSSPISSPPFATNATTPQSSIPAKVREKKEQSGHAVRIDVRNRFVRDIPIIVYDEDGNPQKIVYECMGQASKFQTPEQTEIAQKYGIRFQREVGETGVTRFVQAVFTQPGHYMVNGVNYELTYSGEWKEKNDNDVASIENVPYIDLQTKSRGMPWKVHVYSRSPRDTTHWEIGTHNMEPGDIHSSPDGMYRVYKTSKGELRLVTRRAGPIEVVGGYNMDRQISLGRYNINQKEVDMSSPTQDRRRPTPAPPPPSKSAAADALLRNAAQQSQRESTIFSSNTNTDAEPSEPSTPPPTKA